LTNNPMTMSCSWIEREKQIVLRVNRPSSREHRKIYGNDAG
jgi:hypothetical protein